MPECREQRQVADLTDKLGSPGADLQECVQDRQQMMQSMKNMQPSAPWSSSSVPQEESRARSSGALSESLSRSSGALSESLFSFPPTPLLSLPTQITATPMPGAMFTLIFMLLKFIHSLEKDLHTWGSSLTAAMRQLGDRQDTRNSIQYLAR